MRSIYRPLDPDRVGYVYLITNLLNRKKYVGQTIVSVKKRWNGHVKAAFVLLQDEPLYRAMRKYGKHNFKIELLHTCKEPVLDKAEVRFIKRHNSFIDNGSGYNLTTGGRGMARASKQTCKKLSKMGKKLWATDEHKLKMSAVRKATLKDPTILAEYVSRLHTPESRAKSVKARTGRKASLDHRLAIAAGMRKRYDSQEERKAASKRMQLAWEKPETRRKHELANSREDTKKKHREKLLSRSRNAAGQLV